MTPHRSCDPRAATVLRQYRQARGWNVSEAARRSRVSRRMVGMLEHAQRRPSISTAEALITTYGITGTHAEEIRAIAIPNVGRDSPYKTRPLTPDPWSRPQAPDPSNRPPIGGTRQ